jgi:hypothetical protein
MPSRGAHRIRRQQHWRHPGSTGVELDHAQDILADLMGAIVSALRPGFRLAKLEGDAAFTFAVTPAPSSPHSPDRWRPSTSWPLKGDALLAAISVCGWKSLAGS